VTQVVGCLGRVSNAQLMECDCLAAASERMQVRALLASPVHF
jgi:hypothetical protein